MERTGIKPLLGLAAILVACALLATAAPSTALAEGQSQTVKSNWTKIICILDKDTGGADLGYYYGWKIVSAVTVEDGIVTDVQITGRGEAMPTVPATEKPYFEPCHFLMEEKIIDAKIQAANPSAIDGIDAVTGATSTSHWIKEATKEALAKWAQNNESAKAIEEKINAIATAADKSAAIAEARAAYDAFAEASSYVPAQAYEALVKAEADQVATKIAEIAQSADKSAAVAEARAAYDALGADAKESISAAYAELIDAEAALAAEVDLANAKVTVAKSSYVYTGKAIKPAVTVKSASGITLKSNTDFTVAYSANTKVGTAKITVTGKGSFTGTKTATFKIVKAAQPLTVKAKSPSVAAGKSIAAKNAFTTSKAQGTLSYKNVSTDKTAKKFKVDAKSGKVTVPKGTKKGTYTLKVKITAKGNANYKSGSKTVTVKVKVK